MNRVIHFVLACFFSLVAFAAQPGFGSFNTNQFDVAGNRVALKDGVTVTNLTLTGAGAGNLFEVYNDSNELKFWVDNNGFSYPQIWTNSAGTIQASSAASASGTAFKLDTTLTHTSGNLFAINNNGTNVFSYGANNFAEIFDPPSGFASDWSYNSLFIYSDLGVLVSFDPAIAATSTPYKLDTYVTHTAGNLFEVKNNGTNVFTVPFNGAVFAPSIITTNITVENNITVKGNAVLNVTTANTGTYSNSLTLQSGLNITTGNLTNGGTYVGTIDPSVAGTTLKQIKSLKLQFPRLVDGAGCTYANTNDYTALTFMLPQFSGTAATNVNFCQFAFRVPKDLDTSVDLTGSLTIRLTAADTAAHSYTVGMVSIANSSTAAGTAANYVTLTVGADGSGASGDIENVNDVTLTGWRSNMTAGQWCLVQLQRDGSDSSTVASNLMELEIFYTSTQ